VRQTAIEVKPPEWASTEEDQVFAIKRLIKCWDSLDIEDDVQADAMRALEDVIAEYECSNDKDRRAQTDFLVRLGRTGADKNYITVNEVVEVVSTEVFRAGTKKGDLAIVREGGDNFVVKLLLSHQEEGLIEQVCRPTDIRPVAERFAKAA
jgi:hypothetical protein